MFRRDQKTIPCVCFLVFALFLVFFGLASRTASAQTYDFDEGMRALTSGLLAKKGAVLEGRKIAVFGIVEGNTGEEWRITTYIEDEIVNALVDEGYRVVERSRIDDVLKKEIKKGADLWFDEAQAARFGKLLGADAVVTGKYTQWGNNTLRVNVRCISVADGEVLAGSRVNVLTDRIQGLLKKDEPREEKPKKEVAEIKTGLEPPPPAHGQGSSRTGPLQTGTLKTIGSAPATETSASTVPVSAAAVGASKQKNRAALAKGWDIFNEPLSSGEVVWGVEEGNNLVVSFQVSGARPNHRYTVGAHLFREVPFSVKEFLGYPTGETTAVKVDREGKSSYAIAYDFGKLTTDSQGNGSARFEGPIPSGQYFVQFTVRYGECLPLKGITHGCGAVFRTGERYAERLESISAANVLFEDEFESGLSPIWEPIQVVGGNFQKFAKIANGKLVVTVPENNSWGKTGIMTKSPAFTVDSGMKDNPLKIVFDFDSKNTTGYVIALSQSKHPDVYGVQNVWFHWGLPSFTEGIAYILNYQNKSESGGNVKTAARAPKTVTMSVRPGNVEVSASDSTRLSCDISWLKEGVPVYVYIFSHPWNQNGSASFSLESVQFVK